MSIENKITGAMHDYLESADNRINELEKQLAKKEKVIKGQALYCKQKRDQVEKLEKQLVESVPKSELDAVIESPNAYVHIKKLLTNHKE